MQKYVVCQSQHSFLASLVSFFHPSAHPFTFPPLFSSSVPAAQRVQRDVVGLELAVGVEQQASQVVPQLRISTLEGPQEEASGVVIVSVQVVPDERGALEDRLHLRQAVRRQFPGDDLTACGVREKVEAHGFKKHVLPPQGNKMRKLLLLSFYSSDITFDPWNNAIKM